MEARKQFQTLYSTIKRDVTLYNRDEFRCVDKLLDKTIDYNILNRNHYMIFPVITAYNLLTEYETKISESIKLAHVLDWCAELIVTSYIMLDDMMDHSKFRWGQKCWYSLPEGKATIFITTTMRAFSNKLLNHYFSEKPYHTLLKDLIYETNYFSNLGFINENCLSNISKEKNSIDHFTIDMYEALAESRNAYALCRIAMYSAFYLTETNFHHLREDLQNIFLKISHIHQAQVSG
ncbi:hypothetical protein FQA39_LY13431 [Lamprigera yunnana]|nr:hypothetical protein FQA39_LY13431 [Lamprigera yunnana]